MCVCVCVRPTHAGLSVGDAVVLWSKVHVSPARSFDKAMHILAQLASEQFGVIGDPHFSPPSSMVDGATTTRRDSTCECGQDDSTMA